MSLELCLGRLRREFGISSPHLLAIKAATSALDVLAFYH